MDNRGHIDPQHLTMEDLNHLASCDYCIGQLADYVEAHELLTAPKNMENEILTRSRQIDIRLVAKSNLASKRLQLFYYSLKVSFAAVFAIAFLIFLPGTARTALPFREPPAIALWHDMPSLYDRAQRMSDKLNDFTYQQFETEETPYDKQEK